MPAKSKSQQRLFGMVHAFNKGEFNGSRSLRSRLAALSQRISDTDAKHFAQTPHKGLPEKKAEFAVGARVRLRKGLRCFESGKCGTVVDPKTLLDPVEAGRSAVKFDNGHIYTHPNEFLSPVEEIKEAQLMLRPEQAQALYAQLQGVPLPEPTRSEKRRSLLGSAFHGASVGTLAGGLGLGTLGLFLAHRAAKDAPDLSAADRLSRIGKAGLRCGLWGAGRGALAGAITGIGFNVLDKVRDAQ